MGINQSNPTCEANACLNQVIGISNNNGLAQYLSCVETYSSAKRETVTLAPLNTYTSTVTATASTTDVVVEIRTTEATVYSTSTSYFQLLETVTAYTTTSVLTASTTVTAQNSPVTAKKHKKRGGRCRPTSTTLSALPSHIASSSVATSSDAPLSTISSSIVSLSESSAAPSSPAVSTAASTSSASESSSATTPPPGPVSIALDCPNVEAYSSACSCIYGASDATQTMTSQVPDTTILVTETATVAVSSTSIDWTTDTVTVTVPEVATTTMTSTISTGTVTTTTTTSTCPASLPTETSEIVVVGGAYSGQVLVGRSNGPLVVGAPGTGSQVVVARAGGQPYLASNPLVKMWINYQSSLGRLYFYQVSNPGTTWIAVLCSVSDANVLSCRAGSLDVTTFFTFSTNTQVYMAGPAYLGTTTTPYTVVSLSLPTC